MATAQTTPAAAPSSATDLAKKRALRRRKKAAGRKKLTSKLLSDKEFAKTYFAARGKRAGDKKVAFRKKKSRKK